MTDFLYLYRCGICNRNLSIPLRNIDTNSDSKGIYEQFFDIINKTNKECVYCGNNIKFSKVEFPIKFLDNEDEPILNTKVYI